MGWGKERRSLYREPASVTFIELDRVSDALVIYGSRRRFGKNVNPDYDPARDINALQLGAALLQIPTDPLLRTRFYTSMGNVVDWSRKPLQMPPETYITNTTQSTAGTIKAVLDGQVVNEINLRSAEELFLRWSDYVRTLPLSPHSLYENVDRDLLRRLKSCRDEIDKVDENIITQAGEKGFERIMGEVRRAASLEENGDMRGIDHEIVRYVLDRRTISHDVALIKSELGAGTTDRLREEQMKKTRYEWGENAGLSETDVDQLMDILIKDSKQIQDTVRSSISP